MPSLATLVAVGAAATAVAVGLAFHMWPVSCCKVMNPDPAYVPTSIPDRCSVGDDMGRDLRTKGFTVVRNFLTEEEVKKMLKIHETMWTSPYHPGYKMAFADHRVHYPRGTEEILHELLPRLENNSGIRVSGEDGNLDNSRVNEEFLTTSAFDEKMVRYNWHSDFEAYYFSQATTQYFNIYFFLQKPIKDDAGVSFVPWDELRAISPEMHDKVLGTAAVTAYSAPFDPRLEMVGLHGDPTTDEFHLTNFTFDSIACTPDMGAGDLVVFRGDTLHRTQIPRNSTRVSWSVRISADDFSVARILSGGLMKYQRMRFAGDGIVDRAVIAKFGRRSRRSLLDSVRIKFLESFIRVYMVAGYWYRTVLLEVRRLAGMLFLGEKNFPIQGTAFQGHAR